MAIENGLRKSYHKFVGRVMNAPEGGIEKS